MIDMFTSYQNLSEYYIPNNLSKKLTSPKSYTKLDPNEKSKPYELYNAKGELEGYYWHEGDQLVLDFSIDGEVTVESSAIIFDAHGETPTEDTTSGDVTKEDEVSLDEDVFKPELKIFGIKNPILSFFHPVLNRIDIRITRVSLLWFPFQNGRL